MLDLAVIAFSILTIDGITCSDVVCSNTRIQNLTQAENEPGNIQNKLGDTPHAALMCRVVS